MFIGSSVVVVIAWAHYTLFSEPCSIINGRGLMRLLSAEDGVLKIVSKRGWLLGLRQVEAASWARLAKRSTARF